MLLSGDLIIFSVTIPNTTFRPETELIAPHHKVLLYHEDTVKDFELSPYIKLEHSVLETKWVGTPTDGFWDILIEDRRRGRLLRQSFDHLIVATGCNHFPRETHLEGEEEWLAANRTIMHSMYYRRSDAFTGQNVVVVGAGPSGWDISARLVGHTNSVALPHLFIALYLTFTRHIGHATRETRIQTLPPSPSL